MAVPLKAVHSTSGPKIIFPHFLSVKRVWYIYIKSNLLFSSFLFLLCYEPELNFGRTEVADRDQKIKFIHFVKRATSPKIQLAEIRFHTNFKVHSLLSLTKYGNFSENSKLTHS